MFCAADWRVSGMPNKLGEHIRVVKESDKVVGTVNVVLMQIIWLIMVVLVLWW